MSMEEIDGIIFPILKDIGCVLPEEVTSIKHLQSEHIYSITAACLNAIDPERKLAEKLPQAKAARFRVATVVANLVKDMGFTGEIGYQSFLYPTESEVRRLLSFIIDKVPRVDRSEEGQDSISANTLSLRVSSALAAFTHKKWTAFDKVHRPVAMTPFNASQLSCPSSSSAPVVRAYQASAQPWITLQSADRAALPASIFDMGARDAVAVDRESRQLGLGMSARTRSAALQSKVSSAFKTAMDAQPLHRAPAISGKSTVSSAFSRKTDFTQEKTVVADAGLSKEELDAKARAEQETLLEARATELQTLQEQLEEIVSQGRQKKVDAESLISKLQALEEAGTKLDDEITELEAAYKVKKRVLDMLPNAQENLGKLQALAEANADKLRVLKEEWAEVRAAMEEEYQGKHETLDTLQQAIASKVASMREMRLEMKAKVAMIREKEEQHERAIAELNALPKSINRQVYIKRIGDIVKNINKQKDEIKGILEDVKSIQREINVKGESVRRSFDVADELIYQTAKVKRDPTAIQVYRNVVNLRSGFNHIVETVENAGKVGNNIRELQQKIEQLEAKNSSLNMESVMEDLTQVKSDNAALKKQWKELRAQDA